MRPRYLEIGLIIATIFINGTILFAQTAEWKDPQLVSIPKAVFPEVAKRSGLAGKVTVSVTVDERGNVTEVLKTAGPDWVCAQVARPDVLALREAAANVASEARFTPASSAGKPVESMTFIVVEFPASELEVRAFPIAGMKIASSGAKVTAVDDNTNAKPLPEAGSGSVLNGKAVRLGRPQYPAAARAARATGSVNVRVLIDEDGRIFSAEPLDGHPLLRTASAAAACDSIFSPTQISGQPVKVFGTIKYNFVP